MPRPRYFLKNWQNNNFTMKGYNFGWVIYCAHRFFTSETVVMKWEMSPIV